MTTSFLPTYREFPTEDPDNLKKQLINFHNSTNIAVNNRTISTFTTSIISNGERWYPETGSMRLRDGNRLVIQIADPTAVYEFGPATINQTTKKYGEFFDGTYWQNLPYVDVASVANQISIKVFQNGVNAQLIIAKGSTAPSILTGSVVVEFI